MAELVGGALLSALLNPLVNKLTTEVKDFFKGKDAILKLLKEFKTLLSSADLLLIDAEEKLIKDPRVRKWLDDLKDVIYDADDLVYKIDTEAWRNELEGGGPYESHSGCSCTSKALMRLISTNPLTSFDKAIKPEIEETLEKLKLLLDNKDLGLERVKNHKKPERVCGPLVEESDVYGRDADKEAIIKFLLSDDTIGGDKLSVIPIVGMGGIGKTTLVQLVYNDERVMNTIFDTRVWVTVGDDDKVNSSNVIKTIIGKVTSAKCEIEEEYEVLNEVKKVLTGKKFLIVLDDVWDEDSSRWDVIKSTLVRLMLLICICIFIIKDHYNTTLLLSHSTTVCCVSILSFAITICWKISSHLMAAELVGGALLSAFLDPLVQKLASEVKDFFRGKDVILKLVTELKTLLCSADLLLIDAEEKLIKDARVRKWLDDLKDAIYDADDLVYKIDTEAWQNQLEGGHHEDHSGCSCTSSKVLMKLISTRLTSFDKKRKVEIEEMIEKLKLLLDNKDLGLKHLEKHKLPERVCAPALEESDIYGRDHEKEEIIKLLLSDETTGGDKLSVIPIVGMGGIGKTTLAQLVFKDERVNTMFNTKVWITVGDDKVDCMKVMKLIVEKVTLEKCEIQDPYDLQEEVKKALSVKKFLFVVDDVWDEDRAKWDVLNNCFKSGKHGSKIIVTTRSTVVASIMKTGSTYQLRGINEAAGWRLFAKHASLVVDSNDYLDLKQVGEKIVDKCKGLPLAVKSMGLLLRGKQKKEEWINILNSDLWELYDRKKVDILPALWLSYFNLRPELKQCFAYCSLFPKDYHFRKGEMVLLWMAEGLLQSSNEKRVEEVGEEYFEDLISMSFFQPSNKYYEMESTFLMHDLIHDLAIFVSGEFCYMMNNINILTRLVIFRTCKSVQKLMTLRNLRSYVKPNACAPYCGNNVQDIS
ncbi:putative disease resistance RPP13-like protein 1 [Cannabis sativa]|uniref:putative disease resistance RPP13-like protein 1 n=1 Tax=Cannabis sativa TaxID=3483 RepID=UPI0029CA641F|nr:putative disease resistance RPP13-like protein 1 [Cannabis sativa]